MKEVLAAIFMVAGTIVFIISIFGIYRLKFVMNRIHAAALGDTLGLLLIVIGLILQTDNGFFIAKYILIILFFWLSSPIATNMIAKLETRTNKNYRERIKEK